MAIDRESFTAAHRFGLGPRPGDMAIIARDPRGWVKAQLDQPPQLPDELANYPDSAQRVSELITMLQTRRHLKKQADNQTTSGNPASDIDPALIKKQLKSDIASFRTETASRLKAAVTTNRPVVERLVHFWSNHFTVSTTKNDIRGIVGSFEREAIRPYVLGRFEDMLLASSTHPAMLHYLDQTASIGPNSLIGKIGKRGLNENLAREILELHTLGVDGGYHQDDVIAFARILTGWTVGGIRSLMRARHQMQPTQQQDDDIGRFAFISAIHEPGPKTFMGMTIPEQGVTEGQNVLRYLARHPSTAHFIATKMARHFVADDPPADIVNHLAAIFLSSGGNLRAMAYALMNCETIWQMAGTKVKSPTEYLIALARISRVDISDQALLKEINDLGQVPFSAPSPAGWPDQASAWMGAEALLRRIELARKMAASMATNTDPRQLMADVLGETAHADTVLWVGRAPDPVAGIAMVLASAEFQRR